MAGWPRQGSLRDVHVEKGFGVMGGGNVMARVRVMKTYFSSHLGLSSADGDGGEEDG